MPLIAAIVKLAIAIFTGLFPDFAERLRERRKAKFIGKDEDLQADMEKELEKQLDLDDNPADSTEPDRADSS